MLMDGPHFGAIPFPFRISLTVKHTSQSHSFTANRNLPFFHLTFKSGSQSSPNCAMKSFSLQIAFQSNRAST